MYTIDLTNKCNYCLRCTKEAKELFEGYKKYFNNTITDIYKCFLIKNIFWLRTKGSHLLENQHWVITFEFNEKEHTIPVWTGFFHQKVSFDYSENMEKFITKVLFEKFTEYIDTL